MFAHAGFCCDLQLKSVRRQDGHAPDDAERKTGWLHDGRFEVWAKAAAMKRGRASTIVDEGCWRGVCAKPAFAHEVESRFSPDAALRRAGGVSTARSFD